MFKGLQHKLADWVARATTEVERVENENYVLRECLKTVYSQYTKFERIAPNIYLEAETLLKLDPEFRLRLAREIGKGREFVDVVPRADYEAIRVAYDKLVFLTSDLQAKLQAKIDRKQES